MPVGIFELGRRRTALWLLILLWVLAVARTLSPTPALEQATVALMAVYLTVIALGAGARVLTFAGVLGGASLATCIVYGSWDGIADGLVFAHLIAALLPTLMVIRAAFEHSVEMARSRRRIAEAGVGASGAMLQTAGHALASVLTLGAVAIISPLVPAEASAPERVEAAQATLRGTLLAVLWSPFFVSMAVVTHHLPWLPLWQIVPAGMVMATVGMALALAMYYPPRSWVQSLAALGLMSPIALPVAAMAVTVMAATVFAGMGTIQAIILLLPPLMVLWTVLGRSSQLRSVSTTVIRGLGGFGSEVLVLAAAIVFGQVIEHTEQISAAIVPLLTAGLGEPGLIACVLAVMIAGGLMGVHPMATAPIMLGLLAGLPQVSDLALGLAVLCGWGLGNMVSISSMALATTAGMFAVPVERLVLGRNLLFVCVFAAVIVGILSLLGRATG